MSTLLVVGADRPFLLEGEDAWTIESGRVDVFTVRAKDGEPVGPRRHVLQAGQGLALFGHVMSEAGEHWALLAVPSQNTQIRRLAREDLLSEGRSSAAQVENWIQFLYAVLCQDAPRRGSAVVDLAPGRERELAAGVSVRPAKDLCWISHVEGYSRLMGREGLEVGPDCVPVSRAVWIETAVSSRLVGVETGALPSVNDIWSGLTRLHELVLRHAELKAREDARAFHARMRQRDAFQQAMLEDACDRLAQGVGEASVRAHDDASLDDRGDALFAACVEVGRASGIPIKNIPRAQGAPAPRDPLAAIMRASRVRSRRVALRESWWLEDNGPLLGRIAESKHPVALVRPARSGTYVLRDRAANTERRVDAAEADALEPFAYSFYRPFPEQVLGLRDVLRFGLRGSGRDIAVVIFVATCGSILGVLPAIAIGLLFNDVIPGAQRPQLMQMIFVLIASGGAAALLALTQGISLLRIESRGSAALQAAVWDRLLALPLVFFRGYTSGDLAMRAMSIEGIRQVVSGATVSALMGIILALGNFGLMFWYSPRMAAWAMLIIAVLILITLIGGYLQIRPTREIVRLEARTAGLVLQLLNGIAKLRVAAAEVPAFALWARTFGEQRRLQYKARKIAVWITAFNAAVPVTSSLIIFLLARPQIDEGTLHIGGFLAFLTAFSMGTTLVLGASLAMLATLNVLPLYEQAQPILASLPEVTVAKHDPGTLTGLIEVQHAMFRYHQDGPLVLRDVSFRVKPGEFVAFVGPSGSGKSTLLRVLLGFEALEAGSVYYDGQDIGGLDLHALRRQMGVVLQSGRLMSGDIFMNIAGSSGASLKEAWNAAGMAGLAEDIEAMPMGMHTIVSEGGGTLSGGQRQRLLIARAIVGRPRIFLFDEATSALDNRTQAIVNASLESLQVTRLVVAHRLSTIINADRIFVLEGGRLAQTGTYRELMAQKGPFVELAKRQIA